MTGQSVATWVHKQIASRLAVRRASARDKLSMISFTFDDFPQSALVTAGKILEQCGARATFYASLGLEGRQSSVGKLFTREDLASLIADGHELACHTYSHLSAVEHPHDAIVQSCMENRKKASELFPDHEMHNFSYPFGDVTLAAKRRLIDSYDSCRTVETGINGGAVDMAFLRGNPLYSWRPLAHVRKLIDQNMKEEGWLIFYTHDVCESPSRYGCTPDYFREVVSHATGSGAYLLPVRDAVLHFAAPSRPPETIRGNDHA
jgi:peptidoglycan/xylan/chitin deacetylase (PgdA/CDA1 family)